MLMGRRNRRTGKGAVVATKPEANAQPAFAMHAAYAVLLCLCHQRPEARAPFVAVRNPSPPEGRLSPVFTRGPVFFEALQHHIPPALGNPCVARWGVIQ